ncbi:MAG: hypothetical protein ABJB47_05040 [Actinomycetota bacterium]
MPDQLITAVALYGTKTGAFRQLLETVQSMLSERLGGKFRPYTLEQVHGTVIRLDGVADAETGGIVNQHYLDVTSTRRAMDHGRVLDILAARLTPPLPIRIGGFRPGAPAAFSSRGQHPHERSFSVQRDAFVLMGWPAATVADGLASQPLDDLRRSMNEANVLHWHHEGPADIDNDFHLVVGHHQEIPPDETAEAAAAVRGYLAGHPVQVDVGEHDLVVIASESLTLDPAQFVGQLPLDPADIVRLYR